MVDECTRCCQFPTHIFLALTFPVHTDNLLTQAAGTLCLGAFSSYGSSLGPRSKGRQDILGKKFLWEQLQPRTRGCWWINTLCALPLVGGQLRDPFLTAAQRSTVELSPRCRQQQAPCSHPLQWLPSLLCLTSLGLYQYLPESPPE